MGLTQVSTKGIKDGTILNEDISNSAAIDASKISGLSTDSVTEGNSKAEVIGSGTDDGEFKVTLQDATSGGAGAVSLRQYTNSGTNVTELNAGNTSSNSQLILNNNAASNAWNEILFKRGGASTGTSLIRTDSGGTGGYFEFYPEDGNIRFKITGSATFTQGNVQPWQDSTHDIGTNTGRWRNVYADDYYGSGANLTNLPAAQLTGALPAIDGSNLTGISAGTSLSGSTNDTICTVTGANAIQGEANLTFTSDVLQVSSTTQGLGLRLTNTANEYTNIQFSAARTGADQALGIINAKWNNNHEVAAIYLTAGDDTSNKDDGKIKFYTSAASGSLASRLEILNDGDVKVSDGDLVIGTSGHGIDFSATADGSGSSQAELFDDYEEGTWTPTVSSGNASFSTVEGRYVKVGRLVTLWFRISGGGSYSGSGALQIGGLPFSNNTGVGVTGTSEYYKINFAESYSDHVTPYVTGSNIQWLRNNSGSGSGNYLTISQFYSGAAIKTFICYGTDS